MNSHSAAGCQSSSIGSSLGKVLLTWKTRSNYVKHLCFQYPIRINNMGTNSKHKYKHQSNSIGQNGKNDIQRSMERNKHP